MQKKLSNICLSFKFNNLYSIKSIFCWFFQNKKKRQVCLKYNAVGVVENVKRTLRSFSNIQYFKKIQFVTFHLENYLIYLNRWNIYGVSCRSYRKPISVFILQVRLKVGGPETKYYFWSIHTFPIKKDKALFFLSKMFIFCTKCTYFI